MPDKVIYESVGKMMIDHAPYILTGALALIGATTMIWKKLGFLDFGKDKKEKEQNEFCKHCSLVTEENKPESIDDLKRQVKCDSHESLCDTVKEMRKTQIEMASQQKSNIAALSNGKKEFAKLHDQIGDLRIGVAVLLDRSGGKIKEFEDINRQ